MDIKSTFLNSLAAPPRLPSGESAESFLGQILPAEESSDFSSFLKLLSCGKFQVSAPWSFDLKGFDCFLILYTVKGCGKLLLGNQTYSLEAGSLLLLDCSQRFRIDIALSPWAYQAAFVSGGVLPDYRKFFPQKRFSLIKVTPYCDVILNLEHLMSIYPGTRLPQRLVISDLLGHVITVCLTSTFSEDASEDSANPPPYIEGMRFLFDNEFKEIYTLDELEARFGVSKYRLCREFGEAYGMPPLQYLNRRRIEIAKEYLVTTKHRIHEIGSMVGIDNTNHFIALFKKFAGTTPLEYRQRMTV